MERKIETMKRSLLLLCLCIGICSILFAQSERAYRIGDTGPAGGIIFYDKGSFSNGWRYLEAAPVETEEQLDWGPEGVRFRGLQDGVGWGRQNTRIIVEQLDSLGETGYAAQYCDDLDVNGFTDWFLPSKDELNLMFRNLRQRNLGGFQKSISSSHIQTKNMVYYSSSWVYGANVPLVQVFNVPYSDDWSFVLGEFWDDHDPYFVACVRAIRAF